MSGSSVGSTHSLCLHGLTINPLDLQNPLPPPRTCKKAAVWTTEEEGALLDFLASHLSQASDGNFKKATWNATAAHMAHNYPLGPDNGDKKAESCEQKFKVLKKSYYAITDLKSVASGFAYDNEHGVMILLDNTNHWDQYVKAHKDAKPFRNSSFPHFARIELLLPSHGQGQFIYQPHTTTMPCTTMTSAFNTPASTAPSTTSTIPTPPPPSPSST
ncbi:hypothetical protein M404DRAFT_23411 [Pisolithus tinctorius Marx 270]|uniref:Myb/SANT-like DNA-binding domain-containing protein n=1 Tax=Pisolithus tinctorius Marx 270 TaxID=870435 RepID=A0A0C3P4X6_PISTI|nr:hypothetical protein M404DRAFT_23411 [Pisolithus tinctorius Marx 270]